MPIPFIVWGAAAAGAAYVTWANRKKISAYFESEEGRKLLGFLGKVADGATAPYHNILTKSLELPQLERRDFFAALEPECQLVSGICLSRMGKP